MKRRPRFVLLTALAASSVTAIATSAGYPLDGYELTGIRRLLAYQKIQEGLLPGTLRLASGARRPSSEIQLRLAGLNESYDLAAETPRDTELQAGLDRIFARRDASYRIALVDITEPNRPRFAGVRENLGYIPGSVGKLLVMNGLFHELKRRFGADYAARTRFLTETWIAADRFVIPNSHAVPVVGEGFSSVVHRPVRVGDLFSLWEWVDHMVSPSSNAAASMVWKELMLMRHFGARYPIGADEQADFFKTFPRLELGELAVNVIEEPLRQESIDVEKLRVRTLFTRTASVTVPGKSSHSTPRELVRWLIKLEQGKLVDRWSSLEMKKLLYFTRRRYRYSSSPVLEKSKVFFKSGSLYRCRPEQGYECGQYRGNVENLMHSVAIVESPSATGGQPVVYLISMMSNVLKVNSAFEHAQIAAEIEALVQRIHGAPHQ